MSDPERAPSAAAPGAGAAAANLAFRRPVEADYPAISRVIDDWWGGRHVDALLPRLWLQHFTGTSWVADEPGGRMAGFLVGFHSPDHPDTAYCHLIGVSPNHRGRGLGRALYDHFFADARAAGRTRIVAITWPGNRGSLAFHRALGFDVDVAPGSQNLYGTPSTAGYDFDREDRTVLTRLL